MGGPQVRAHAGMPPRYNISGASLAASGGAITNAPPRCVNLFSPAGEPWAFHHVPLAGRPAGYPVWLDVQHSEPAAAALLEYVREALFLDAQTQEVTAQVCTYNAALHTFALGRMRFRLDDGGHVVTTSRVSVLKVRRPTQGVYAGPRLEGLAIQHPSVHAGRGPERAEAGGAARTRTRGGRPYACLPGRSGGLRTARSTPPRIAAAA